MVYWVRVTHPFTARVLLRSLDLHVLGMPPALILSQDRTLKKIDELLFSFQRTFLLRLN